MSVLQSQPPLSISTNQCKKQFLSNQISQMKITKDIYLDILHQLKSILKETSQLIPNQQQSTMTAPVKCLQTSLTDSVSLTLQSTRVKSEFLNDKNDNTFHQTKKISNHIKQFTSKLQQKIKDYCCSQISQNIVKYLEIQKQERHFYPKVTENLTGFIKNHEKMISQREKQLQEVEDLKYINPSSTNLLQHNKENNKKANPSLYSVQKDRQTTQKTISSFDFNKRVLEVAKKQITFLKLKKRKLEMEIQERKKQKNGELSYQQVLKSYNYRQSKKIQNIHESTAAGISEELNVKKLPGLKNNSPLKSSFRPIQPSKNQISAFQKIVMVYQKDKFINILMEQKINKLSKKVVSQKRQNIILKQKTYQLEKQILKLDWNKVCNQSFIGVQNKKLDRMLELSILDRTDLKPCDEMSVEYSKMSINQSVIKRF